MQKIIRITILTLTILALIAGPGSRALPAIADRTILANDRGFFYTWPYQGAWDTIGAYIGGDHFDYFQRMSADAYKGMHGRFQHFLPADQSKFTYFPYNTFQAYNNDEVAHGRPSLWVTATYNGKQRPVLFSYVLDSNGGVNGGRPQLVNVADDRYIQFFIHNYIRTVALHGSNHLPNMWTGLDNCMFQYQLYGVYDNNGTFVRNVTWDQPYPQNDQQFTQSIATFFQKVKQRAPDVLLLCNEGTLNDESQYANVYGNVDGRVAETLFDDRYPDATWGAYDLYNHFLRLQIGAASNKFQIIQVKSYNSSNPSGVATRLRTGYVGYAIMSGSNAFFGPTNDDSTEPDPNLYLPIQAALGAPTGAPQSQVEPNTKSTDGTAAGNGFRLYSRSFEGGLAYLNWTGTTKTIALPGGQPYYDRNGNRVTQLTIPNQQGDYVTTTSGAHTLMPQLGPRRSQTVSGAVQVTLSSPTSGATIRYTLDGSEPTGSSPVYAGPLTLNQTATVKAKAFGNGLQPSFTASANYTITGAAPSVQFHLSQDSASKFIAPYYPLLKLSNPAGAPVTVQYAVTGGTAQGNGIDYTLTGGSVTFRPGEVYQYFPIQINPNSNSTGKTIQITLSNPQGATLGTQKTFLYTISDSGSVSPAPTATATPTKTAIPAPTNTPKPTNTPAAPTATPNPGTGVSIYQESLASGWKLWSCGSTINLATTNPVYAGSNSMSVTFNEAYANLCLHTDAGQSLAGLTTLQFYINGGSTGNQQLKVEAVDTTGATLPAVDLNKYVQGGTVAANSWRLVSIPLADLKLGAAPLATLLIQDYKGTIQPTFYLDNIQLTGGSGVGPTPTNTPKPTNTPVIPAATPTNTPKPTNTPAAPTATPNPGAGVSIYQESLASGWKLWSCGSTINLATKNPVYAGSNSMSVTFNEAYANLCLHTDIGQSLTEMTTLQFYINGGSTGNQQLKIYAGDTSGASLPSLSLNKYIQGGAVAANSWRLVSIPLADLKLGKYPMTELIIQDSLGKIQPSFYLDNIQIIR